MNKLQRYEKMTFTDHEGERVYHNVNGRWYNELMHEGEWALYEISEELQVKSLKPVHVFGTCPRTTIVHSRIYQKTRPFYTVDMPVMWCGKNEDDIDECVPVQTKTERYDAVCHTELYPTDDIHCHECGARIPDKFLTIWRMLEANCMDKTR